MKLAPRRTVAPFTIALAAAALAAGTPAAGAATKVSAPLKRGTVTVGTASALLVTTDTGIAIVDAKVTGFLPPEIDKVWRARTAVKTGCAKPGYEPATDDAADFDFASFTSLSLWRSTRVRTMRATVTTNDQIRQCPEGQSPAGAYVASLTVTSADGTKPAGIARLFAAR